MAIESSTLGVGGKEAGSRVVIIGVALVIAPHLQVSAPLNGTLDPH